MPDSLRIVLFGAPAAGKSSLIGALVQAGPSQSAQLGGQFHDVGGGMTELKNPTYQKGPAPTQDEVRDYPFAVEPLAPGKGTTTTATLTDCSGQAAQALLAPSSTLPENSPLAQALLGADALMLLVDASANVEQEVSKLAQFLRLFQTVRGQRADIAGMPVYLVLSKCDLIAKPGDSYNQWIQRIEESKSKLDQRFQAVLKEQADVPFGQVQLHLWATAVKRPALADRPAKAEPFGVTELFRQGLVSAQEHYQCREHASGRLSLAVAGMLGLVAVLTLLAGVLYLVRPSAELTALENQVRRVLPGSSAADRLRDPLEERFKELGQIQENPHFAKLPPKLRDEVAQARIEIEHYQKLNKDFAAQVSDPRFATRDEELDRIEKNLNAFSLPDEYAAAWADTKFARRLQQWKLDVQKVREAGKDEETWMRQQVSEADKLKKQGGLVINKGPGPERDAWFKHVQEYLDREPRHKRADRVAPGASLTYDHVYRLQRVEQARKAWDGAKNSLKKLRELAQ